ncbi:MAG: hypothetical protein PF572_05550 [Patescibacteria group bacterium]|jgi:hypothetical protein|nr:hypothetical protein [Patescibacteria group bacterium]
MRKIFLKNLTAFAVIMMLLVPAFVVALPANATGPLVSNDLMGNDAIYDTVSDTTGLGNRDPREIAAAVIRVMLGFLGIIAVLIILYAGFLWMTAAGNEDKISQAKGMMSAGVIGLIIILAAFGIATFVMNALVTATA